MDTGLVCQIAQTYGLHKTTVYQHLNQGFCTWPRKYQSQGRKRHPLYSIWNNRVQRCRKPGPRQRCYKLCSVYPPWQSNFWAFVIYINTALGEKPTPQHTLDRIDSEKGYTPSNLRWATPKQQCENRRPYSISVQLPGWPSVRVFAEAHGVKFDTCLK